MAMTTKQASEKWGISDRRVRVLCLQGKIDGAWREGKSGSYRTLLRSRATVGIKERISD